LGQITYVATILLSGRVGADLAANHTQPGFGWRPQAGQDALDVVSTVRTTTPVARDVAIAEPSAAALRSPSDGASAGIGASHPPDPGRSREVSRRANAIVSCGGSAPRFRSRSKPSHWRTAAALVAGVCWPAGLDRARRCRCRSTSTSTLPRQQFSRAVFVAGPEGVPCEQLVISAVPTESLNTRWQARALRRTSRPSRWSPSQHATPCTPLDVGAGPPLPALFADLEGPFADPLRLSNRLSKRDQGALTDARGAGQSPPPTVARWRFVVIGAPGEGPR